MLVVVVVVVASITVLVPVSQCLELAVRRARLWLDRLPALWVVVFGAVVQEAIVVVATVAAAAAAGVVVVVLHWDDSWCVHCPWRVVAVPLRRQPMRCWKRHARKRIVPANPARARALPHQPQEQQVQGHHEAAWRNLTPIGSTRLDPSH